jgi:hypothetical protein
VTIYHGDIVISILTNFQLCTATAAGGQASEDQISVPLVLGLDSLPITLPIDPIPVVSENYILSKNCLKLVIQMVPPIGSTIMVPIQILSWDK